MTQYTVVVVACVTHILVDGRAKTKILFRTVFLNRGSTEPLMFDGAVSGVQLKSFNILTLLEAYPVGRWPLDFERKLDVGRRDDLFFGLHLSLGGKLDVTLSVSGVRLRQPRSCWGSATWHGLRNSALENSSLLLFCMYCGFVNFMIMVHHDKQRKVNLAPILSATRLNTKNENALRMVEQTQSQENQIVCSENTFFQKLIRNPNSGL